MKDVGKSCVVVDFSFKKIDESISEYILRGSGKPCSDVVLLVNMELDPYFLWDRRRYMQHLNFDREELDDLGVSLVFIISGMLARLFMRKAMDVVDWMAHRYYFGVELNPLVDEQPECREAEIMWWE